MIATIEKPTTGHGTHWSDRPVNQLPDIKIPSATLEHLKRQGIDTIGKMADALNDGRDIGLGDRAESFRAAIEDLIRDEVYEAANPDDEAAADAAALEEDGLAAEGGTEVSEVDDDDEADGEGDEGIAKIEANETKPAKETKAPSRPVITDGDDRLEDIYTAHRRVMNAAVRMNRAKAAYKTAKDEHDEALIELQAVIMDSNQPTLFDQPKAKKTAEKASEPAMVEEASGQVDGKQSSSGESAASSAQSSQAIEDCWKQFPLERWKKWGITDGILGKLAEASPPILTVGDLNAYTAPKGNGYTPKLTDINGIGKAAAQKIEDAGINFWQWFPENRDAFAKEQGINGPITEASGDGGTEATPSEWAEPGVNGRAEK